MCELQANEELSMQCREIWLRSCYRRFRLLCVVGFLSFNVCCSPKNTGDVTNVAGAGSSGAGQGANGPDKKVAVAVSVGSDSALGPVITALQAKYDIESVFAWVGPETDGRIMWADHEGRLRSANFVKDRGEYQFLQSDQVPLDNPWSTVLAPSPLAPLVQYLSDTEFPVRVDTIQTRDCTARIILLWRAENRSLIPDPSGDRTLALPGIRVVLSQGAEVLSNSTINFECLTPREVLVDDVNNDGINDYCFIGKVAPLISIWTLTDSCSFQSLEFLEDGERSDSLEGAAIHITKGDGGQYSINVWSKVPFKSQLTEEVYRWDPSARAFVVVPRSTMRNSR